MDARLQRRVQRYGWDRAVQAYARHWREPLSGVQAQLLAAAAPAAGEDVLDVACGTGDVTLAAAKAVGPGGSVLGVDISEAMVRAARARAPAGAEGIAAVGFNRMDAEQLELPDARFDLVLCALGLMYLPEPDAALREMWRVLRPGGRVALAVWGERARCGWASLFGIVDDEVHSEVCPLFFGLGQGDALAQLCRRTGFAVDGVQRRAETLAFAGPEEACAAAFAGGPVALAWSRFDATVRQRVQQQYLRDIEPWKAADAYRIPAEFVILTATRPAGATPGRPG